MNLRMPHGEPLRSRLDQPLTPRTLADEVDRAVDDLGHALRVGDATTAARKFHQVRVMWEHYRILTEGK